MRKRERESERVGENERENEREKECFHETINYLILASCPSCREQDASKHCWVINKGIDVAMPQSWKPFLSVSK